MCVIHKRCLCNRKRVCVNTNLCVYSQTHVCIHTRVCVFTNAVCVLHKCVCVFTNTYLHSHSRFSGVTHHFCMVTFVSGVHESVLMVEFVKVGFQKFISTFLNAYFTTCLHCI